MCRTHIYLFSTHTSCDLLFYFYTLVYIFTSVKESAVLLLSKLFERHLQGPMEETSVFFSCLRFDGISRYNACTNYHSRINNFLKSW